ncbi:MAG TPA: tRNA pseudouridine(55) synthase TruB [Blastocatellia bacterium]|nr:tRNA pseudouridine(55) synthase TruB [Blastocatellia bacterium]
MDATFLIDKPAGLTSHDVVAAVRRLIGMRRVGHAGTLDPFATGLLVVSAGKATRLVQYLIGLDKTYLATVRLGFATDTQDFTGKQITPLVTSKEVTAQEVSAMLARFTGPQTQTPPMFSAKKVAGERLYKTARAGRVVERPATQIVIHSIELMATGDGGALWCEDGLTHFKMRVRCSSGTYVRTLADDMGRELGTGGHLSVLRRTAVGSFELSDAITLERLDSLARGGQLSPRESSGVLSLNDTLPHLAVLELDAERVRLAINGREVYISEDEAKNLGQSDQVKLCGEGGVLLAVAGYDRERHIVRPRVVIGA